MTIKKLVIILTEKYVAWLEKVTSYVKIFRLYWYRLNEILDLCLDKDANEIYNMLFRNILTKYDLVLERKAKEKIWN